MVMMSTRMDAVLKIDMEIYVTIIEISAIMLTNAALLVLGWETPI